MCGRETPSGGNFGISAFADHLHAHKNDITHCRKGKTPKSIIGPHRLNTNKYELKKNIFANHLGNLEITIYNIVLL